MNTRPRNRKNTRPLAKTTRYGREIAVYRTGALTLLACRTITEIRHRTRDDS